MMCKTHFVDIVFKSQSSFFCTLLNGSNYCYVSLTIQLDMLFVYTPFNDHTVLFLTTQPKSFVCTQFKCQRVLFDL